MLVCEGSIATARPHRIAYVLAQYPAPSETFIAREIAELRELGVEISVYAFRGQRQGSNACYRSDWKIKEIVSAGIDCIRHHPAALGRAVAGLARLWRRPVYALRAWRQAIWALPWTQTLRKQQVDRVHAHFANLPADVGLFVSRVAGVRFSFSGHARDVFLHPVALSEKCASADVVFACNESTERLLKCAGAKVMLMHHGLDLDAGPWDTIYGQRCGGTASSPARILAVGRFVPKKGFDILIAALVQLRRAGFQFTATLAGGGPERDRLEQLIEVSGLGSQVCLLNFLTQEELIPLWREADVFVQPSVVDPDGDRDGIPNTLLEAMAAGVPVVGSSLAGIHEVLRNGETGFIARMGDASGLADAIRHAASSPHFEITGAARDFVRANFDLKSAALKILRAWDATVVEIAHRT
jgi:glycosyltransferase involved in cell wall biosynthesis